MPIVTYYAQALRQYLRNRPPAVSNRYGPAGAITDQHFGIDTQAMIDCCANVAGTHRPVLDVGGMGVGRELTIGHANTDGIMDICVATKVGLAVFLGQ